jgi:multidrug resistance efflux pump
MRLLWAALEKAKAALEKAKAALEKAKAALEKAKASRKNYFTFSYCCCKQRGENLDAYLYARGTRQ